MRMKMSHRQLSTVNYLRMRISFNWLKQYLNFDLSAEETAYYLTNCGLEVEGIETFEAIEGGLEGLVTGEVLTCEKHHDSDHLHLTTVDIGKENPLHIVCGAPNVAKGQKVIVATIGTKLYSGGEPFVIKKSKIRGELSEGMICAEDEIGIGNSHEGIMVLDENTPPGIPASTYFKIEKDYVFEIGLTPNRNDAMSHFGVARDLHAVFNVHNIPCSPLIFPKFDDFIPNTKTNTIDITVENTTDCPRYTGIYFENVIVKESPEWLKNRLRSIGIRPLNNIVDITQYVMFEMGQPLHAFDADFIKGNQVIVRNLPEGTPFTTLDGNEVKLSHEDLMICNAEEGMCIAGVYGGLNSGVTEKTRHLFLESAYFNPKTIRKTAKRHNLKTDASFRYERGCDPDITVRAIRRAANLIQEIAGANIISEIVDVYPKVIEPTKVHLSYEEFDKIAGITIDALSISKILLLLGMEVDNLGDEQLLITIPPARADVTRSVDLIEEILRIYGYDKIEVSKQITYQFASQKITPNWQKIFSVFLADRGFYETINNSLTKEQYALSHDFINEKETVYLLNPLSNELNVMRQTLLFSGLENIAFNSKNKNANLRLFEFGNVYAKQLETNSEDVIERFKEYPKLSIFVTGKDHEELWNSKPVDLDIFYLKNIVNDLLVKAAFPEELLKINTIEDAPFLTALSYLFDGKTILTFGQIHPAILKSFEIKKPVYYAEIHLDLFYPLCGKKPAEFKAINPYPSVKRDLALVVDQNMTYAQLEMIAYKYASKLLKNVSLFDVYEGDKIEKGKKSYALNFILQHPSKTLTDEEIQKVMNKLTDAYQKEAGATLRSS